MDMEYDGEDRTNYSTLFLFLYSAALLSFHPT